MRAGQSGLSSRLAAAACGVLVVLVLGELGVRLIYVLIGGPPLRLPLPYPQGQVDRLASGDGRLAFDPDLGWVPTPSFVGVGSEGLYRHNEAGLRADHEYTRSPRDGIRRIAAYGDSYTYCEEVDVDDCWTAQLEELLPEGEVLNFGVSAYGPDQAWLRYQRDGATWRPCTVLIGVLTENINRVVNRFRPFYTTLGLAGAKPRYVLEGERLVLLPSPARKPDDLKDPVWVEANLGPRDAWYVPGMFVAGPLDRLELVRLTRSAIWRGSRDERMAWSQDWAERAYRPGTEPFEVLAAVLVHFAEEVRADGATPVVLVFPRQADISLARDSGRKPYTALLDTLAGHGIPTIDLTDAFVEENRHSRPNDLVGNHYRPLGNAVVAGTLAERLPRLTAETCGRS